MPRLDLNDQDDAHTLYVRAAILVADIWEKDASADVCIGCHTTLRLKGDAAHPPYEDKEVMVYRCILCGKELTEEDN